MNIRLNTLWTLLSYYKYLIVVVVGVLVVGIVDENSFAKRVQYELEISDLKEEIAKYQADSERDTRLLKELRRTPKAIEKIARERYFMKAEDEDIYVLSDDVQQNIAHETAY